MADVLILGARKGSLGEAIRDACNVRGGVGATAGVSGDEDYHISNVEYSLFDFVICTIGINEQNMSYTDAFVTNCAIPMENLRQWLEFRNYRSLPGSFVFVSSNSAYIARSPSGPYCASKAALTMAVRCEARKVAQNRRYYGQTFIYSYEPCWIEGTPMSDAVTAMLPSETAAHRIPGGTGLLKRDLASLIVDNLGHGPALHGANLRVDLGEQ